LACAIKCIFRSYSWAKDMIHMLFPFNSSLLQIFWYHHMFLGYLFPYFFGDIRVCFLGITVPYSLPFVRVICQLWICRSPLFLLFLLLQVVLLCLIVVLMPQKRHLFCLLSEPTLAPSESPINSFILILFAKAHILFVILIPFIIYS
jgi:hypothetical protein